MRASAAEHGEKKAKTIVKKKEEEYMSKSRLVKQMIMKSAQ